MTTRVEIFHGRRNGSAAMSLEFSRSLSGGGSAKVLKAPCGRNGGTIQRSDGRMKTLWAVSGSASLGSGRVNRRVESPLQKVSSDNPPS